MDAFTMLPCLSALIFAAQAATTDILASFAIFTLGAIIGCVTVVAADHRTRRRRRGRT